MRVRICLGCRKTYKVPRYNKEAKYCSKYCYLKKVTKSRFHKVCIVCSKKYTTRSNNSRYCSQQCVGVNSRKYTTIYDILPHIVIHESSTLNTGCWSFRGRYSTYKIVCIEGNKVLLHRAMYEHFIDIIPKDKELHHECTHRWCCNFEHLETLTRKEHAVRHLKRNTSKQD